MVEDLAVAMHRLRQHEFERIAARSVEYEGLLITPCTYCHSPRATIFSSSIFQADMQWQAYCVACKEQIHTADITMLAANYDLVRCGTWIAQFGVRANGECVACGTHVDFYNFHRAHDRADKDGGENSVRNSYVSCQTCNVSTGTRLFSKVITDTRAHMGRALLHERSDSAMVERGIVWMRKKRPLGPCQWDSNIFPQHLRYNAFCDGPSRQRIEQLDKFRFKRIDCDQQAPRVKMQGTPPPCPMNSENVGVG
jgi:hypothetical protein